MTIVFEQVLEFKDTTQLFNFFVYSFGFINLKINFAAQSTFK